jgi:hypothetical protein
MLSLYPADNPQLLVEDLQVMEAAALEAMSKGAEG